MVLYGSPPSPGFVSNYNLRTIGLSLKPQDWSRTPGYKLTEYFPSGRFLGTVPSQGGFLHLLEVTKKEAWSLEQFIELHPDDPLSEILTVHEVHSENTHTAVVMGEMRGPFFSEISKISKVWPTSPSNWDRDRGIIITVVGEQPSLREMAKKVREVMSTNKILFTLSSPKTEFFVEEIPDRRRQTVKTAISMGYYEYPRRCTQRDIADRLDLKQATVSEHLQRGEMSIMTSWSDTI